MDKKKITAEEAKDKAKGFLGYIKHLVKDPVKTVPESKQRRKELLTPFLISLGLIIVPIIVMKILGFLPAAVIEILAKVITVFVTVGAVGVIFFGILLLILLKISMVLKLRECTNCKEQITYGDNVTYKVLREWEDKQVSTNNGRTNVDVTERAEVLITCVCQNCGTTKEFKHEFRLAKYHNGSLSYSYQLDDLVKGFFTGEHIQ